MDSDKCMFEANDAIIYHGHVSLKTESWEAGLEEKAVSKSSPSFGKSFCDIFEQAERKFYNIDPAIFAPGKLTVEDTKTGKVYESKPI